MIFHYGKLYGEQKLKMFERADIFILPTDFDACPRVIIEAMEYGLPIISTHVGTIPSMVSHSVTGLIIQDNTPNEIFNQICNLNNAKLREKMTVKSRERFLTKFTMSSYKKKLVSIILSRFKS